VWNFAALLPFGKAAMQFDKAHGQGLFGVKYGAPERFGTSDPHVRGQQRDDAAEKDETVDLSPSSRYRFRGPLKFGATLGQRRGRCPLGERQVQLTGQGSAKIASASA